MTDNKYPVECFFLFFFRWNKAEKRSFLVESGKGGKRRRPQSLLCEDAELSDFSCEKSTTGKIQSLIWLNNLYHCKWHLKYRFQHWQGTFHWRVCCQKRGGSKWNIREHPGSLERSRVARKEERDIKCWMKAYIIHKDKSSQCTKSTNASMLIQYDIKFIVLGISVIIWSDQAVQVKMIKHPHTGRRGEGRGGHRPPLTSLGCR